MRKHAQTSPLDRRRLLTRSLTRPMAPLDAGAGAGTATQDTP